MPKQACSIVELPAHLCQWIGHFTIAGTNMSTKPFDRIPGFQAPPFQMSKYLEESATLLIPGSSIYNLVINSVQQTSQEFVPLLWAVLLTPLALLRALPFPGPSLRRRTEWKLCPGVCLCAKGSVSWQVGNGDTTKCLALIPTFQSNWGPMSLCLAKSFTEV